MTNCVITGVGGQGTILASRLIGLAAMEQGLCVRGSETIGMAQRGGSVVSHVRMGSNIHSPLILPGQADIVIAFEPGEGVRAFPFLAPDGVMAVCNRAVQPVGGNYSAAPMLDFLNKNTKRLVVVDGEGLVRECGTRYLNAVLIGAALASGAFPFTAQDAEKAMAARLPERYLKANLAALRFGMKIGGSL